MMRRKRPLSLPLIVALTLAGCRDPEDGRPRGGGNGGDGGNYVRGDVHPPSKIDGTKDLSLLRHDGPRPRGRPQDQDGREAGASRGSAAGGGGKSSDAKGEGTR
jgi:hypothetical protein